MNNQDTPETNAMASMRRTTKEWIDHSEKLERERNRLRQAIRETLMENLHLADGDICTLKRLKDAIGFELPETESTP